MKEKISYKDVLLSNEIDVNSKDLLPGEHHRKLIFSINLLMFGFTVRG